MGIYDLRGRLVTRLVNEQYAAGDHAVTWQGRDTAGRDAPSGVYFIRVDVGGRIETRKAMLLR